MADTAVHGAALICCLTSSPSQQINILYYPPPIHITERKEVMREGDTKRNEGGGGTKEMKEIVPGTAKLKITHNH